MAYSAKMKKASVPAVLAGGLAISWVVTALVAAITATAVSAQWVGEEALGPGAVTAVLLGALAGSATAAKKAQSRKLLLAALSGGVYFISLLCCNALFFDGTYQGVFPAFLMTLGCGLVTGMGSTRQKRSKFRYSARR